MQRIVSVMTEKAARRALDKSSHKPAGVLAHCQDIYMQEKGIAKVLQVVRCVLEIVTYAKKEICVKYIFKDPFNQGGLTVSLINGGLFLLKVLEMPSGGQVLPSRSFLLL